MRDAHDSASQGCRRWLFMQDNGECGEPNNLTPIAEGSSQWHIHMLQWQGNQAFPPSDLDRYYCQSCPDIFEISKVAISTKKIDRVDKHVSVQMDNMVPAS